MQAQAQAQAQAHAFGLRLQVFDAFRPIEAQWVLWNAASDKRFVADPRLGGVHPRGAAIDLTLDDAVSGESLDMGARSSIRSTRSRPMARSTCRPRRNEIAPCCSV